MQGIPKDTIYLTAAQTKGAESSTVLVNKRLRTQLAAHTEFLKITSQLIKNTSQLADNSLRAYVEKSCSLSACLSATGLGHKVDNRLHLFCIQLAKLELFKCRSQNWVWAC